METLKILPDGRMPVADAAKYVGFSKAKMDLMRCHGDGPRFVKLGGRVFYFKSDLDTWINSCRVQSVSEARVLAEGGAP